jgi:hypothetical protein
LLKSIDDAAAHLVPCQFAGQGQANRAGAYDQDIRHGVFSCRLGPPGPVLVRAEIAGPADPTKGGMID